MNVLLMHYILRRGFQLLPLCSHTVQQRYFTVSVFWAALVTNPNRQSLDELQKICKTTDPKTLESLQVCQFFYIPLLAFYFITTISYLLARSTWIRIQPFLTTLFSFQILVHINLTKFNVPDLCHFDTDPIRILRSLHWITNQGVDPASEFYSFHQQLLICRQI